MQRVCLHYTLPLPLSLLTASLSAEDQGKLNPQAPAYVITRAQREHMGDAEQGQVQQEQSRDSKFDDEDAKS